MMRCAVKGSGRVAPGGKRRSPAIAPSSVRMPDAGGFCCGVRSRVADLAGVEMARLRGGVAGLFRPRYGRLRATAAVDPEDIPLDKVRVKSSGNVLPYVGVACLGAILFGYHLGVVNGALEFLAKDLGIAENAVLQGWVVSTTLAGATVGSFTGGALADKFGRTRTFMLDAIPLAVGAFLSATAQDVRTMIIGRLLAGIGIGISSALVPLYISEISPTEMTELTSRRRQLGARPLAMASEKEAALAAVPNDNPTIFDKIINKEIPSTVVYEDEKVLAFRDINPQAPTHILIIPKIKDGLTGLSKAEERHVEILGYLLYVAKVVAKQEGLEDGYRVVINDGPSGCQSVYHIHVHLLGGRQMNWPPG